MTVKFEVNKPIVILFYQKDGNKLVVYRLVRRSWKNSKYNFKIYQVSFLLMRYKEPAAQWWLFREHHVSFLKTRKKTEIADCQRG